MSQLPIASFSHILQAAVDHYSSGRQKKRAIMVLGAPGGGKTALGDAVADALGFGLHERALTRPSFHTPVDYAGAPSIINGCTVFCPPSFIHRLTTGEIKFWTIDELPDATQSVQNVITGGVYDFDIAGLKLHPDLCIYITGNRASDKSGAGRVITKLANRVYQYELAKSVDDFVNHGLDQGWDADGLAYIHWKGEAALYGENGFDPNVPINNSPRQWEEVFHINRRLPAHLYLYQLKALIQQGDAEMYAAFLRTVAELPPIDQVMNHPDQAPVSEKVDVNYALTSRLTTGTDSVAAFQKFMRYIIRLPVEMQTLYINSVRRRIAEIRATPEYVQWCTRNQAYYGADV